MSKMQSLKHRKCILKPDNDNMKLNLEGDPSHVTLSKSEGKSRLVDDLTIVLNEKIKLENENNALKIELHGCKEKLKELENTHLKDVAGLSENIRQLQEIVKQAEVTDAEKDKMHAEKERLQQIKINDLNETYFKERTMAMAREEKLLNEVTSLKHQLGKSKQYLHGLTEELKQNKGKVSSYKEKLKFSVNLISRFNSLLNQVSRKYSNIDKDCQTDANLKSFRESKCARTGCSLECENMVLTELFFRENPFTESADELFFTGDKGSIRASCLSEWQNMNITELFLREKPLTESAEVGLCNEEKVPDDD